MGAKGAVEILHRKADDDERAALIDAYEERLLNPYIAAERGSVDQVIDPIDTRKWIVNGIRTVPVDAALRTRRRNFVDTW